MVNQDKTPFIETNVEGAIGWLVLNRPERKNALTHAMWQAIPEAIAALAASETCRLIVLRGKTAEAFAAGADISEFAELRKDAQNAAAYEATHVAALAAIRACAKPVIAMIEGYCIGGGLAIALACDLRYAGPTASFALPPAKLGLAYPADSLCDLLSAVGADTAKEMIFTARRYGAPEAEIMHLITATVENPEQHVRAIAAEIAANAPLTMASAKAAIDHIANRSSPHTQHSLQALADACFNSEDYAEGQRAFMEKRKPVFRGK